MKNAVPYKTVMGKNVNAVPYKTVTGKDVNAVPYKTVVGKDVKLVLRPFDNAVHLIAINRYGTRLKQGTLLEITADGKILRHVAVAKNLGLDLDDCGRINIKE